MFVDVWDTRKCLEVTCVHSSANRVATFVLREGFHGLFCTGTLRKLHNTIKPKHDVLFKKLDFEEIGVNQRSS